MNQIKVTMKDTMNEKKVERVIDISNIMIAKNEALEIAPKEQQTELINSWINERANAQHNTILELVKFEIV